jgi:hypothetical protein
MLGSLTPGIYCVFVSILLPAMIYQELQKVCEFTVKEGQVVLNFTALKHA